MHGTDRKPFDLLSMLSDFGLERGMRINHPETIAAFLESAKAALTNAQDDSALLHGQRTQAMFEAMVVSLGAYRLLKSEDNGSSYSDGTYAVPDFRIVLPDGEQWLVEVKNVYMSDPFQQSRRLLRKADLERLAKYSHETGGKLKLAVYWARWALWTLVSPERVVASDGSVTLDFLTAVKINELAVLGDRMVGTKPPLKLRLLADSAETITVDAVEHDGSFGFTIADAQLLCGEDEIVDSTEREIAWAFMLYGDWGVTGPEIVTDGEFAKGVEWRLEPLERQNQGYEIIGTLSQMFARYFSTLTVEDEEVVQIHAPQRQGWFSPLVNPGHQTTALPLWLFKLQPNYGE